MPGTTTRPRDHRPTTPGLVSVVIPTHDRRNVVTRAIDSALGQTYPAIEVLIVDDASADDTAELVEQRYRHEPRVRLLRRPHGGAAAARNTGIAAANGEYIAFLDSDDTWLPWKTELQVAYLDSTPEVGMVWTDFAAVAPDDAVVEERYLRVMYKNMRGRRLGELFGRRTHIAGGAPNSRPDLQRIPAYSGDVFAEMLLGSLVHTSTVMLRSTTAADVGPFDETLVPNGEDFEYHLRTVQLTPVGFIDVPTTRYQVGSPDQLTSRSLMVALAQNGLRAIVGRLAAVADDPRVSRQTARRALSAAHEWLGAELIAAGDRVAGRRHLRRAFCRQPTLRCALRFAGSFLTTTSDSAEAD